MVKDDGSQGESFNFWADASTSWGCAAFLGSRLECFAIKWPHQVAVHVKLTCLAELVPVVYSFFVPLWAGHFYDRKVTVFCDNMATVRILNKMSSRVPAISEWLRPLALRLMHLNVKLRAVYVETKAQLADPLSRGNFNEFFSQVGCPVIQRIPIPSELPTLQSLKK